MSTQTNKDLVNLCEKRIVSEDFHGYFMSLPANSKCKDNIPEGSDQDDSDSDLRDWYLSGDLVFNLNIVLGLSKHSVFQI